MVAGNRLSEVAEGRGMAQAAGAVAVVLLLALGVFASAAQAEPLAMTFTEGRANVGDQLSDDALFAAPNTAPFAAQIDPGSGSITAGALQVPQFSTHITSPLDADVAVDFEIGIISGSFTQSTGALTLSGKARGTLTANGKECFVATDPAVLSLSTAGSSGGTSPRSGAPFFHTLAGAGAIAGEWTSMEAQPVDTGDAQDVNVCEVVEEHIEGPGGVWLQQTGDVVAPAAPKLTRTAPASPGRSGRPRIRGVAEAGSTVRLYAGSNCAGAPVATGSAAQLESPGLRVTVAAGDTASFSATATDAPGNTSACSAPISYTHSSHACVVPNVVGKKLKAAKRRIRAAGCTVGKIHRPRHRRRRGVLVVKSTNPAAGATAAKGKVSLRLGPKQ